LPRRSERALKPNLAKTHFVAAPVVEFSRFDVRVTSHPLGDVNVAAAGFRESLLGEARKHIDASGAFLSRNGSARVRFDL
jgi:hypothetical protein